MRLLLAIKVRARQALPQVLAACMVAYFAYHALHGDRGFYAWIMLKQERAQVMAAAAEVAAHRARLAHRVGLLRRAPLATALLEASAEATLQSEAAGDHNRFLTPALWTS